MAERPSFIDLSSTDNSIPVVQQYFLTPNGNLPTPQTGAVPPALSPLDAFAFQSRLLAKKFEEEDRNGKRLSRLPPLTVVNEFGKPRPTYFREDSFGAPDTSPVPEEDITPRSAQEIQQQDRPRSHYPVIASENSGSSAARSQPFENTLSRVAENDQESPAVDYFYISRSQSPELLDQRGHASMIRQVPEQASSQPPSTDPRAITYPLPTSLNLRLPASPNSGRSLEASPNISSVLASSTEDIENLSLGESISSLSRQRGDSPLRMPPGLPRSPSLASERSIASANLPRPSFNYSRPLSRPSFDIKPPFSSPYRQDSMNSSSTRPSLEVPSRQDTGDSPITPFSNDLPHTPVSITSDEYFAVAEPQSNPTSSYTYSKYSLPRGKSLKRESIGIERFFNQIINWDNDESAHSTTAEPNGIFQGQNLEVRPPLTDARPSWETHSLREPVITTPAKTPSPPRSRRKERPANIVIPHRSFSAEQTSPRKRLHKTGASSPGAQSKASEATKSSNASTIKARLTSTKSTVVADMTPDEHLQRGIELHDAGALQESTYHLRLSAKAGHATAMLLYALACRHGWGMKPNAAEGVAWLQRAVDSAQLEIADDEDLIARAGGADAPGSAATNGPASAAVPDAVERKTHKARFALSVYELGVSYMNGWGLAQDRSLGLRCFEVAGNWGDADALAEAGFCYAEGVGCRKDLRKAARFYRAAERKGMSMAGNSW